MAATLGIYLAFMVLVKIFGSRVLTSVTASDAVIIIMFGAVSGRVIAGNPPTLAAGIIGLTTLMVLEATFGTVRRFIGWSRFIDRPPVLLMFAGEVFEKNINYAHISRNDISSAVRKAGLGRLSDVQVMILEPTGQISIIRAGQPVDPKILSDVRGAKEALEARKQALEEEPTEG
ncbi:membrane protein [Corynebacterium phocae]|uniref:Membrane protein n=1 Tax=Corynebacterium phocae TaxID=161895 RepID=A0A1L7D6M3_9CORY|nr:membrane protein [Corynebacterium phocae]KAA8725196.1 DUF421 domain-containing protein [Corynebacterium phocae]